MRKEYISPLVQVELINTTAALLAASLFPKGNVDNSTPIDGGIGE